MDAFLASISSAQLTEWAALWKQRNWEADERARKQGKGKGKKKGG